jgi:hypothetical protein
MAETKELATRMDMNPAEFADIADDFKIDNSDILIPKILLMQPSSEMVADEKIEARIGDFRNSVSGFKVGSILEPFLFIPFHYTKKWDVVVKEGNKWVRTEPFNVGDENLPWEYEEAGTQMKRVQRLDFFGFVPGLVDKGEILPMVFACKSTGYKEGKKILTQMKVNIAQKKLPWNTVYAIGGEKRKNDDDQTYCVPKIQIAGDAHEDHLRLCMEWYRNIKNMTAKVVVDESDVESEYTKDATRDVADTGKF